MLADLLPIPFLYDIRPQMLVMAIYYCSVYAPSKMPFWLVFLLGIVSGTLLSTPIGAQAIGFVLIRLMCGRYYHLLSSQSFSALWAGFALAAATTQLIIWVSSIILFGYYNPLDIIASCALSIVIFPAIAFIMHHICTQAQQTK